MESCDKIAELPLKCLEETREPTKRYPRAMHVKLSDKEPNIWNLSRGKRKNVFAVTPFVSK